MKKRNKHAASKSTSEEEAAEEFIRDAIERGDAAERDEHGNLPANATHEITGHDADGKPIVKRRRTRLL